MGNSCCHCTVDRVQHVADKEDLQVAHSNTTAAPALLHCCRRYYFQTSLMQYNLTPGWSSFMVPSLSTFFKQTTSARSLNYHYKRNILATNIWFGLIFAGLAIFLNVGPDSSGVNPCIDRLSLNDRVSTNGSLSSNDSKTPPEAEFRMSNHLGNPLKRNHLFTCYNHQIPTYDELSLSHLPCKK